MPFLRVIRDKRGYETTYLMHWYREGSRQRSRILYVFRTPGGVRVGREPLEPEILKQIEREYPDIDFDWQVVVDNQQVVETNADPRRPRKRRREDEVEEAPAAPVEKPVRVEAAPQPAVPPRPPVPSTIEGATPDEQIAFLVVWYPQIRERIQQRTTDQDRVETLLALCERLNTTSWSDADQITTGLQQAVEALERLSRVLAKRRRRARRPRKPGASNDPEPASAEAPNPSTSEP